MKAANVPDVGFIAWRSVVAFCGGCTATQIIDPAYTSPKAVAWDWLARNGWTRENGEPRLTQDEGWYCPTCSAKRTQGARTLAWVHAPEQDVPWRPANRSRWELRRTFVQPRQRVGAIQAGICWNDELGWYGWLQGGRRGDIEAASLGEAVRWVEQRMAAYGWAVVGARPVDTRISGGAP